MSNRAHRGWCLLPLLAFIGLGAASEPRLIEAVKGGDQAAVRTMLKQRVDVNAPEADGTTALHWAVHRDNLEVVEALLQAGAKVGARNRYGVAPLTLACVNANPAILDLLLAAGADPNTTSADGETALMTAARTGRPDVIKRLVARGADVNAKETWREQTALMWAVAEKHPDAVRALLVAGADPRARSKKGFSPFLFAVRGGDQEIVQTLLDVGADVNEVAGDGVTALIIAIVNAHYDLAAWLLEKGADPNVDTPGGTALHAVTRTRNYEYGKVVRPAAVQTGSMDALQLVNVLFKHGVKPNAQIVKPLPRQGGFDNNFLGLVGATPLLLAAKAADPTLMRLLIENGADPFLPTKQNVTPLMVAAGAGYVQGQSIGEPRERTEAVRLLLELGADVNLTSDAGETAMHGAATGGVNDVVQLLADKGAKLDAKAKDGTTPLAIADGTKSAFRAWPQTAAYLQKLLAESQGSAPSGDTQK